MKKILIKIKEFVPLRFRYWSRCMTFKKKNKDLICQVFEKQEKKGLDNIPIFLISYNRLSFLKSMIKCLEMFGKKNIYIIDNASSYPPLLDYYKTLPYKVFYLEKNGGHKVFWENPIFESFRKDFYVVSDPDIEPIDECPADFVEHFFQILKKHPFLKKTGFSLKIDDLPKTSPMTHQVLAWEKRFYKCFLKDDQAYYAPIDTTFALYVPDVISTHRFGDAIRTAYPYQARHVPWYKDPFKVTDEDKYYAEHKTNGWWNVVAGQKTPDKEK